MSELYLRNRVEELLEANDELAQELRVKEEIIERLEERVEELEGKRK